MLAEFPLRGQAFIVMMQAAEFRERDYPTPVRRMHDPRVRRIHRQGKVRSPVVVVIEISGNDTPEMAFVQNDEMIKAIAAQGSDPHCQVGGVGPN